MRGPFDRLRWFDRSNYACSPQRPNHQYWMVDVGPSHLVSPSTPSGLPAVNEMHWRIPYRGAGWCFALRGIYVHVLCDESFSAHCQQEGKLRAFDVMTRVKHREFAHMMCFFGTSLYFSASDDGLHTAAGASSCAQVCCRRRVSSRRWQPHRAHDLVDAHDDLLQEDLWKSPRPGSQMHSPRAAIHEQ